MMKSDEMKLKINKMNLSITKYNDTTLISVFEYITVKGVN